MRSFWYPTGARILRIGPILHVKRAVSSTLNGPSHLGGRRTVPYVVSEAQAVRDHVNGRGRATMISACLRPPGMRIVPATIS